MANVLAPFGFRWARQLTGTAPNCAMTMRRIALGNATPIYHNDPITSLSTGYIQQSVAGTTTIGGIFVGCKYISVSQGRTVWMPYWPGSDAQSDPEAYIIDDPNAVFMVQANAGPVTIADVGSNANFALGAGNTASGLSGASLNVSTIGTTATLPFRIVGFEGDGIFPAVGPGSDATTAYNNVFVTFNNQDFKSTTGV